MNREILGGFIKENQGCALTRMKHKLYDEALLLAYGNVSEAARMLGVSRSALNNYANKWEAKTKINEKPKNTK